jgi:hypothetical protein
MRRDRLKPARRLNHVVQPLPRLPFFPSAMVVGVPKWDKS